jgi:hypothetical protein
LEVGQHMDGRTAAYGCSHADLADSMV